MERMRLPSGEIVHRVDKEEYLLCEKIRNYILRLNYEFGIPIWICTFRAAKKFNVTENYAKKALRQWRRWYYENGLRHRPIELFIQEKNGYTNRASPQGD